MKGTDFYQGAQKLAPYWSAFYPYWNHKGKTYRGDAWTQPDFPHYIDFILALARKAGLNTLRATDFLDGATKDWRNPTVWANMDYFVHKAARRQHAAGIGFWNLGLEAAPGSFEVEPQTPLTFAVVQHHAPTSTAAAPSVGSARSNSREGFAGVRHHGISRARLRKIQ